ncbi:hypothetical protein KEM48_009961 [Puccinia striiformis f. sp. tritici PST-130]|nr:hypothetical protein KEM48_009961 [Puccinia striiformis f. sp. tritici PST-130]
MDDSQSSKARPDQTTTSSYLDHPTISCGHLHDPYSHPYHRWCDLRLFHQGDWIEAFLTETELPNSNGSGALFWSYSATMIGVVILLTTPMVSRCIFRVEMMMNEVLWLE